MKRAKKILAVISIFVLLAAISGTSAFAAGGSGNTSKERTAMTAAQKAERQAKMEEHRANGEKPKHDRAKGERPELTDEQKAEMKAKMEERLAKALADGKITQEQYDAMINGEMPMRGERGKGGEGFPGGKDKVMRKGPGKQKDAAQ